MIVAFTVAFILTFILNMIGALGLKSLIEESDMYWLKNKPARVVLLIPPVSIVVLLVGWVVAIVTSIVGEIKDYLD